jgi:hypothetical protein
MPEVTGWNVETLKELLDIRFDTIEAELTHRLNSIEKDINERFLSQDKATTTALKAVGIANEKAEHLADIRTTDQEIWRRSVDNIVAQQTGSKEESSNVWAKWAVLVVSAGTLTTLAVTIFTLFWGH